MIFIPTKLENNFKFNFDAPFEEHFIEVNDDVKLNALHFKRPNPNGSILYLHGNAGDLSSWGSVALDFLNHNYEVLIIDYRGYGKSEGSIKSEEQLYNDAQKAYDYAVNKLGFRNVTLFGRSIGTGISSWLAMNNDIDKLILETPYFSFKDLVGHIMPIAPKFVIKYELDNAKHFEKIKAPIYLIHGTTDELIPFNSSLRLKEKFPHIRLFPIENGHHNDLSSFVEYQNALRDILE